MARAQIRLATVFLIFCFVIGIETSTDHITVLQPPHGGSRPALLLPLVRSPRKSSRTAISRSRRHLGGSESHPNAHMTLYDDQPFSWGYSTRLWIGTPPQEFTVDVDSGSDITYVPCSRCDRCGILHQDSKFDPELSTTYEPVICNNDCRCDRDRLQCIYERQFSETSISSGVLGKDRISFGDESSLEAQRAVFGCEHLETGYLYSQHADGIMGLGRGNFSIMDQLVEKGAINDSFSLCYGGMEVGAGAMVLGGISLPSDMVFTDSDPARSPYYNIELKEIHIAGKRLPLNPKVFDGKYGTFLDSGTTFTYLPEAAFLMFKDAIMKELQSLKKIDGPSTVNDICFNGAGSDILQLWMSFPAVDMVFSNGQKWPLSPENYLYAYPNVDGAYCLAIFPNGKDQSTILGEIAVRNTLVTYDRERKRVGFWKTNCSELWERLQISYATPPQLPPASNEKNSTADVPPTMAPSGSPNYTYLDEFPVEQIIFYLSLSTNYTNLKPRVTELTKCVIHELNVSTPQVHLLNFTSYGNGSLLRWAVIPPDSAHQFSNATAMRIIARISKHRFQIPNSFRTYHVVTWSIVSSPKRTWVQQHYMVLAMIAVCMVIMGLSASGMRYIWARRHQALDIWRRRQQSFNAYEPVGGVTEQEPGGGVAEQEPDGGDADELESDGGGAEQEPGGGSGEQELATLNT